MYQMPQVYELIFQLSGLEVKDNECFDVVQAIQSKIQISILQQCDKRL